MTARPVKNWPRAMAKRMGLGGEIEFTRAAVGQTLHLFCAAGNHVVDEHIAAHQHPDAVVKKLLGKGWTMGSKLKCPEHSRRPKAGSASTRKAALLSDAAPRSAVLSHAADKILSGEVVLKTATTDKQGPLSGLRECAPNRFQRRVLEKENSFPKAPKKPPQKPVKPDIIKRAKSAEQEGKPMPEVTATPTDAAKRAQRMIYLLLEEQYDEGQKRYRAGWSDAKVSIESGAHVNVVTKIREDFFGPLGEPSELTELRRDIEVERERLRLQRENDDKRLLNLENKLARLCEKNGWSTL